MRYFLLFWLLPMGALWGWYGLSYHDVSLGMPFMTREANDLVFTLYGNILGIEPETIPPLVARATIVDSFLLLAIVAFRKRKTIAAWARQKKQAYRGGAEAPAAPEFRNLSSAP